MLKFICLLITLGQIYIPTANAEICDVSNYISARRRGTFTNQQVQESALPALISTVQEYLGQGHYKFVKITSLERGAPSMTVEAFLTLELNTELSRMNFPLSIATLDQLIYSTLRKLTNAMQYQRGGSLSGYQQESVRDHLQSVLNTGRGIEYQRPPI